MQYQPSSRLDKNAWVTDPIIPDPENLPTPLGWCVLVRPYPVTENQDKTSVILLPDEVKDGLNHIMNIGRVVSIGPCCWTRNEHKNVDGQRFNWVEVGDFVSFPKNVGARRKFKGVSYTLLVDDEIVERLPDPQIFEDDYVKLNIPMEHLKKYNTIYKETN